jgi:hypothetical protein
VRKKLYARLGTDDIDMMEKLQVNNDQLAESNTEARQANTRGRIERKHSLWDPMLITSPYIHSRIDSNTINMGNPMPESTFTLRHS